MDRPKRPVSTGKRPVYEPCMPHSARIVQDFYPARRAARRPPASPGKGDPASPCSALFGLVGASSGFCHLYSGGGGSLLRTRLCRKPLQGGPVVRDWVGFGGMSNGLRGGLTPSGVHGKGGIDIDGSRTAGRIDLGQGVPVSTVLWVVLNGRFPVPRAMLMSSLPRCWNGIMRGAVWPVLLAWRKARGGIMGSGSRTARLTAGLVERAWRRPVGRTAPESVRLSLPSRALAARASRRSRGP